MLSQQKTHQKENQVIKTCVKNAEMEEILNLQYEFLLDEKIFSEINNWIYKCAIVNWHIVYKCHIWMYVYPTSKTLNPTMADHPKNT